MRRRRLFGISLIEILISVLILAIGLIAVVNCVYIALATSLKAYRLDQATAIAESKIELLRSTGAACVDTTTTTTNLNDANIPNGQISYTITTYNALLNIHKVVVVVTWTGAGQKEDSVRIETLVGDRARYIGG
ncbi:MAG: type IV pilus modification PilV family protein [Armatimonadota bacterium]